MNEVIHYEVFTQYLAHEGIDMHFSEKSAHLTKGETLSRKERKEGGEKRGS